MFHKSKLRYWVENFIVEGIQIKSFYYSTEYLHSEKKIFPLFQMGENMIVLTIYVCLWTDQNSVWFINKLSVRSYSFQFEKKLISISLSTFNTIHTEKWILISCRNEPIMIASIFFLFFWTNRKSCCMYSATPTHTQITWWIQIFIIYKRLKSIYRCFHITYHIVEYNMNIIYIIFISLFSYCLKNCRKTRCL